MNELEGHAAEGYAQTMAAECQFERDGEDTRAVTQVVVSDVFLRVRISELQVALHDLQNAVHGDDTRHISTLWNTLYTANCALGVAYKLIGTPLADDGLAK